MISGLQNVHSIPFTGRGSIYIKLPSFKAWSFPRFYAENLPDGLDDGLSTFTECL